MTRSADSIAAPNRLILTGHSRGLGAAIGERFLDQGGAVLGISRRGNPPLAARFRETLQEIALDLADAGSLLRWLSGTRLKHFLEGAERVYLINNAGLLPPVGPVGTQDGEAIVRSVALNVTAPFLLANAVAQAAPADAPCRILHISSGVGRRPCAGWSVYSATKAALDHHARSAGLDATPHLKIASLAPGVVDTDLQAEIRAGDAAAFPLLPQFLKLKEENLLVSPQASAEKILRYLLADDFKTGDIADVREFQD